MPKTKTRKKSTKGKSKRRIRRNQKSPRLGYYLLAAFATIFLMWIFIREPLPAPQDLEPEQKVAKKSETKKAKSKERTDKGAKEKQEAKQEVVPEAKTIPEPKIIKEDTPKEGETKLDLAIRKAASSIGVPDKALKRRKAKDLVNYSVPINRSQMDLTYANMIFKGTLEQAGASLLRGEDSRNKQTLNYYHRELPDKYQIELFYDSNIYKERSTGKRISIVIDDFGPIGGKLLDGFLALDTSICFAIMPGETNSVITMQRAAAQGRETLIHVPMEPIGYPRVNPGKNAILVQQNETQVEKLLSSFINELPLTMGINNHMGSLATSEPELMQTVMQILKKHNKAFLDSRTTNVSIAYQSAQKAHIKAYRNDLFLDSPNISQSTMDARLNDIMQLSASKKHVIAITHCHSLEKLQYLKNLINRLQKAGFTLVPLSSYGSLELPEIL
ncbi:MAG: divergent polysaccharide deacetylase family protein [Candidatus Cloacimonetes bacterium]|nr:divergent polysaccharide deacetylase family protein [Candidatus Cloacimonadota bacterium]